MFEITKTDCPRHPRYANTHEDVFDIIYNFFTEKQAIEASSWAELACYDETFYDSNDDFIIYCFEEE